MLRLDSHLPGGAVCPCGQSLEPASELDHVLTCASASSNCTSHNAIAYTLASILAAIPDTNVFMEVNGCPAPGSRMDIVASSTRVRAESAPGGSPGRLRVRSRGLPGQPLGERVLIDTTITHPLRAHCVSNATGCPAYAANKAAEVKITKYWQPTTTR